MNIKIVNAFGMNGTGGNPAGLVLNADNFTTAQKQWLASKIKLSETAFVSSSKQADYKLEFFTPEKQIPHCGHATIATFSYLKQIEAIEKNNSSKETIDGLRNIYFEGEEAFMEQLAPSYRTVEKYFNAIYDSIGITEADIISGLQPTIVNTGNSFLLIPIDKESTLKNLKPKMSAIKKQSEELNIIGYYAFTTNQESVGFNATTRMFAPFYGIEEEAATGMAAGPLAAYLYDKGLTELNSVIQQGMFMEKPSPSLIKTNIILKNGIIEKLFVGGGAYVASEVNVDL